jgi:prefoldin subunit 5
LGNSKKKVIQDKDELIKSLKFNIKEKEGIIKDLMKEVTELERRLEEKENDTCVGI